MLQFNAEMTRRKQSHSIRLTANKCSFAVLRDTLGKNNAICCLSYIKNCIVRTIIIRTIDMQSIVLLLESFSFIYRLFFLWLSIVFQDFSALFAQNILRLSNNNKNWAIRFAQKTHLIDSIDSFIWKSSINRYCWKYVFSQLLAFLYPIVLLYCTGTANTQHTHLIPCTGYTNDE